MKKRFQPREDKFVKRFQMSMKGETKKVDESSTYTDSGFHSGFQDSCEISSSADKEMPRGISQDDDKEWNHTDSGIIVSGREIEIDDSAYVPDCLIATVRPQGDASIQKYFEQDDEGFTQLHIAILHEIEPAVNTLITLVPDTSLLNIRNFCGQTALHLAVLLDQPSTVKKLINAGADVNLRDNRCNTALHLACLNNNVRCFQAIISAVYPQKEKKLLANLEQWNYEGETCFFIACKEQNVAVMKALVNNGANVNAREGRSGYTAMHMAVEMKANAVVKFLCEECSALNIDTENYGGLTAFQLSLLTEQEALANYLVTRGATPYFTDMDSDMEDDSSSDISGDELEKNQIISKIAEIAVN